MKKILLVCLLANLFYVAQAQQLVSVQRIGTYTQLQLQISFFGIGMLNGAEEYKITYNTTDVQGNATVASGALYLPWGCGDFPLAVYQHGTVFSPQSVPSRKVEQIGLALAGFGYAAVAPDYLGLGDNAGVHPYLHAETQATAAIDLMRAAREYFATQGLTDNGEVFLTGYSQGGHAAMALHKYIEDEALLSEFNVVASAPLSGPYDLAGVQTQLPADSTYSVPAYLPYLVESMQLAYGNLYTDPSAYYQHPFDSLITLYQNGTKTFNQIEALFPNNIFDFMQPSMLNAFSADTIAPYSHPFRVALSLNANYDWTPTRPVRMVYCTADEQVYYQNALNAAAAMTANGATDVQAVLGLAGGTHSSCFFPALLYTLNYFNGLKTSCTAFSTATATVDFSQSVTLSPNPTTDAVQLDLSALPTAAPLTCRIYDLAGQLVSETMLNGEVLETIDLTGFAQGVYVLQLQNKTVRAQLKVVKM
jgi:hypothetical protein